MTVYLARPKIMKWHGKTVTDHNRSELAISEEIIEKRQRVWDGTLRKYHINVKKSFSCSWEMLPATGEVVGGGLNGRGIETFYENHKGAFQLKLYSGEGDLEIYNVMFAEFTKAIVKRGKHDFWNLSVQLDEV